MGKHSSLCDRYFSIWLQRSRTKNGFSLCDGYAVINTHSLNTKEASTMAQANRLFSHFVLAICLGLLLATSVGAQGKQAVVIKRSEAFKSAACDGAPNLEYEILFDVKLNNKDEVRLLNLPGWASTTMVSRKTYEDSGKRKMRDLFALKWDEGGVLTAVSSSGQAPLATLPDDTKPQKNIDQQLQSFYGVMLTGEVRDGKTKRKVDFPLRSIWKVFFVAE